MGRRSTRRASTHSADAAPGISGSGGRSRSSTRTPSARTCHTPGGLHESSGAAFGDGLQDALLNLTQSPELVTVLTHDVTELQGVLFLASARYDRASHDQWLGSSCWVSGLLGVAF